MFNNKGFTLIELLISLFIFSFVMLGMISGYVAEKKLLEKNIYRDMAIEIASENINQLRNEDFDSLTSVCSSSCNPNTTATECYETKNFRNKSAKFGKSIQISTGDNPDLKNVTITICWQVFGHTYNYSISSIIRKE